MLTKAQKNVRERVQQNLEKQAAAKIMELMGQAVFRAIGGRKPSDAELKQYGKVQEIEATGQTVVWWREEAILMLTPSREGMTWEFMGAAAPQQAAQPQPAQLKLVGG